MIYGTVICLGDSLTTGARSSNISCWPFELEELLWRKYKQVWNCVPEATNGELIQQIYARAYGVCKSYPEADEVVLFAGTNNAKSTFELSAEYFIQLLSRTIRVCQRWGKFVYLCSLPGFCGFGSTDDYSQVLIEKYNSCISEVATEWRKYLSSPVDLVHLSEFSGEHYADGVHFSPTGNIFVANLVLRAIEKRRLWKRL